MSIQQVIDEQSKNPDLALGNIVVNGESGSFSLTEGLRVLVRNAGSASCIGNEGRNEVQFVDCGSASVKGFHDGIVRFERCGSIEIETTGNVQIHLASTTAKVVIQGSRIVAVDCQLTLESKSSEVSTFGCTGSVSMREGGRLHSDGDNISATLDGIVASFSNCSVSGKYDNSVVTCQSCKGSGIKVNGGQFLDQDGDYGGGFEIINGVAKLIRTKMVGSIIVNNGGAVTIEGGRIGSVTAISANIGIIDTEGGAVSVDKCSGLVLIGCKLGGLSVSKTPSKLVDCKFGGVSVSESSVDSQGCTIGDYSHSGGTISSAGDEFGVISCTGLRGPNQIYNPKKAKTCIFAGSSAGSLSIRAIQGQDITVGQFCIAEVSSSEFESGVFSNIDFLTIGQTDISGGCSFSGIGTVVLAGGGDENSDSIDADIDSLDSADFNNDGIAGPGAGGIGAGGSGFGSESANKKGIWDKDKEAPVMPDVPPRGEPGGPEPGEPPAAEAAPGATNSSGRESPLDKTIQDSNQSTQSQGKQMSDWVEEQRNPDQRVGSMFNGADPKTLAGNLRQPNFVGALERHEAFNAVFKCMVMKRDELGIVTSRPENRGEVNPFLGAIPRETLFGQYNTSGVDPSRAAANSTKPVGDFTTKTQVFPIEEKLI